MSPETMEEHLLEFMRHKVYLRARDLEKLRIPRVVLSRLLEKKKIEKVAPGLYRSLLSPEPQNADLALISRKVPRAVFCLLTALEYHGLGTQVPKKIWLAMPTGSHTPRILYPPVRMVQFSGMTYSEGIETHREGEIEIRVYSPEKTIADCFRYRNVIGIDVAIEALRDANTKNIKMSDIWKFAKLWKVQNTMRPYLEMLQ
ncbi:MAG: type IV toxin-antitoxin system AbiEi family antitoxin domain-containing protein [Actinomycetota bacterium]